MHRLVPSILLTPITVTTAAAIRSTSKVISFLRLLATDIARYVYVVFFVQLGGWSVVYHLLAGLVGIWQILAFRRFAEASLATNFTEAIWVCDIINSYLLAFQPACLYHVLRDDSHELENSYPKWNPWNYRYYVKWFLWLAVTVSTPLFFMPIGPFVPLAYYFKDIFSVAHDRAQREFRPEALVSRDFGMLSFSFVRKVAREEEKEKRRREHQSQQNQHHHGRRGRGPLPAVDAKTAAARMSYSELAERVTEAARLAGDGSDQRPSKKRSSNGLAKPYFVHAFIRPIRRGRWERRLQRIHDWCGAIAKTSSELGGRTALYGDMCYSTLILLMSIGSLWTLSPSIGHHAFEAILTATLYVCLLSVPVLFSAQNVARWLCLMVLFLGGVFHSCATLFSLILATEPGSASSDRLVQTAKSTHWSVCQFLLLLFCAAHAGFPRFSLERPKWSEYLVCLGFYACAYPIIFLTSFLGAPMSLFAFPIGLLVAYNWYAIGTQPSTHDYKTSRSWDPAPILAFFEREMYALDWDEDDGCEKARAARKLLRFRQGGEFWRKFSFVAKELSIFPFPMMDRFQASNFSPVNDEGEANGNTAAADQRTMIASWTELLSGPLLSFVLCHLRQQVPTSTTLTQWHWSSTAIVVFVISKLIVNTVCLVFQTAVFPHRTLMATAHSLSDCVPVVALLLLSVSCFAFAAWIVAHRLKYELLTEILMKLNVPIPEASAGSSPVPPMNDLGDRRRRSLAVVQRFLEPTSFQILSHATEREVVSLPALLEVAQYLDGSVAATTDTTSGQEPKRKCKGINSQMNDVRTQIDISTISPEEAMTLCSVEDHVH